MLKLGDRGDGVRDLQADLAALGYHRAGLTGFFGRRTEAAVLALQSDLRLCPDGVVGPATRARLDAHLGALPPGGSPVSGVLHYPSPNFGPRPDGALVDTVVVHYTEASLHETFDLLAGPSREASTHFVADRDGRLFQLVHPRERAWHAGRSEWRGRERVNDFSIGIDAVFHPRHHTEYTGAQYEVIARVVRELCACFPLRPENLVGHEHVAVPRGRKADPGPCFDWDRLRALLASLRPSRDPG